MRRPTHILFLTSIDMFVADRAWSVWDVDACGGLQVEALLMQLADTPSAAFGLHNIMLHARATEGQWLRPSQARVPHVMRRSQ